MTHSFDEFLGEAKRELAKIQDSTHEDAVSAHAEIHKHLTSKGFKHTVFKGNTKQHGPVEIHSYNKDNKGFNLSIARHPKTGKAAIVHHADSTAYKMGHPNFSSNKYSAEDRHQQLENHTSEGHKSFAKGAIAKAKEIADSDAVKKDKK